MNIHIVKPGPVPVHTQLREQIIFKISTGELPVGRKMPSVRELERRLKINRNTISHVYAELVEERWLVKRPGSRMIVVQPDGAPAAGASQNLDALIDRMLLIAKRQGLSTQQLVALVRNRALAAPPNHFLIVEPEPGMGELMKHEIRQATGRTIASYPIPELKLRPELLAGAILLVPVHLKDLLDFAPEKQFASAVVLYFSSIDPFVERVRKLKEPCIVGMFSVSGPGMTTLTGEIADSIGARHALCHYRLEWPPRRKGQRVIRRFAIRTVPPELPVRDPAREHDSGGVHSTKAHGPAGESPENAAPVSVADLRAIDLLFCDSITYDAVKHPNRVKYQLLSPESLEQIAAAKLDTTKA